MRGALDCVAKITPTESTEVFSIDMSSNSTLNEARRDVESQSSKTSQCSSRHSIWWTVATDVPLFLAFLAVIVLFELGVIPSYKSGFFCNDPALSFQYKGDTVTTSILIITIFLIPLGVILVTEYIFYDAEISANSRIYDTLKSSAWLYRSYLLGFLMTLSIVEVMKGLVGAPRPSFFDVCEPDTGKTCKGSEYVPTYVCTSTKHSSWNQMDAGRSFPSGHTSQSVYCGLFIAWYLQKRGFSWQNRSIFIIPFMQSCCIFYAAICSLTRITDHRHHWWDVLTGAVIGVAVTVYIIYICDNFSYGRKKNNQSDIKSENSQNTEKTLVFDERS